MAGSRASKTAKAAQAGDVLGHWGESDPIADWRMQQEFLANEEEQGLAEEQQKLAELAGFGLGMPLVGLELPNVHGNHSWLGSVTYAIWFVRVCFTCVLASCSVLIAGAGPCCSGSLSSSATSVLADNAGAQWSCRR